jgi:MoaA/NifB/PqqE/SkfB family radical SAM enzyme
LINHEIAKSFREFQQNYQFTPVISLDSHLAEFHEPCRGRFEDVIKSLEILKEYDVDFAVDITLGKHNSENILDTVRFVVENHTKNIVLCKLRPVYSSAKAEDFLSNEEILSIYNEVIELKEEYGGFNFFHSFDATGEEFCTAGMDKMSIGSDGSVFPCYMLEAMSFGNIDDTPLAELVELMRIKFGRNDIRQIVCQSPEYAKLLFDNTTVPSISLVD